jgi:hypothetical protein
MEKGDDLSCVDETMLWGEETNYFSPFLKLEFQNTK